jgi:hypothetical protein
MKKQLLFFRLLPGIFIFFLSSCINHDYDLTDENLDKDVVFSPGGFNVPVGSIDTIFIGDELRKFLDENETEILTDPENGVFYIQYSGEFPVEFPEYTVPEFKGIETEPVDVEGIVPKDMVDPYPLTLPFNASDPIQIVSDKQANYNLEQPYFRTPKEGLEVSIEQSYFSRYELNITVYLYHMKFLENSNAKLLLAMDFPNNFTFQEGGKDPITGKTHIEKTIDVAEFKGDDQIIQCTVTEVAKLFSYKYDLENVILDYNVTLQIDGQTDIRLTDAPEFNMDISINNDNVALDYVIGSVIGIESIAGSIETGDFTDAFKGNILDFKNPSLYLNLQSNLQVDFNMDMILVAKGSEDEEIGSAFVDNLEFGKSAGELKEEQYLLSPIQPEGVDYWKEFKMNTLFRQIPKEMTYEMNAHFNENNVKLYPEGLTLSALYTIKLPFDFEDLSLQISDTITDLFSEELYDALFEYAEGNLKIQADNVDLVLGTDMSIEVTAKILDENYQGVGIADQTFSLQSGPQNKGFAVEIKPADMEKMVDARHLEFAFRLKGSGAIIDVNYNQASYIHIQKLRIISDAGVHYEIEL